MTARVANRWDPSVPVWAIPRIMKLVGGAIRKCDWCSNWYKQSFVGNPRKYCCEKHRKHQFSAPSYARPDVGEGPPFQWSWLRFFFLNSGLLCESSNDWRSVTFKTDDDGKRLIVGYWRGYRTPQLVREVAPDFSPWWGTNAVIIRLQKETEGTQPVRFRGRYLFQSGVHRCMAGRRSITVPGDLDISQIPTLRKRGQKDARFLPVHIDPEYVWRKNPYGGWTEIKHENAEYLDMLERAARLPDVDGSGSAGKAPTVEPVPSATWSSEMPPPNHRGDLSAGDASRSAGGAP